LPLGILPPYPQPFPHQHPILTIHRTAIYFPVVVVFLAATQGINLNAGDYTIIVLLSTLSSVAATPIPSSSLVLTVMIAGAVNIPITGMYAVVVAVDWFIDRFRTATNVSGDMFAAKIFEKVTGITDQDVVDVEGVDRMGNVGGGAMGGKDGARDDDEMVGEKRV
jgi:Na+/H+-dicarboxylate symporter